VLSPYTSAALPDTAQALLADGSKALTPIDYGDVCLNADDNWFAEHSLAVPQTLDDLVKPEYKDLLVVTNPASSSPGLSFLIATVGAKGEDGWLDYWAALRDNGVKVVSGWTQAYEVEFSGGEGKGAYPLVLSYASSPGSTPGTSALTQTCFRQVEYAGILAGAQNPDGAALFIEWLLSTDVQAAIPDSMWMYPVLSGVTLPDGWDDYVVTSPITVPAATISAQRDAWLQSWTTTVLG